MMSLPVREDRVDRRVIRHLEGNPLLVELRDDAVKVRGRARQPIQLAPGINA